MISVQNAQATISETLRALGLWSQAAEDLVLGTGAQESQYKYTQQLGGGPALGYWQMETATHDDCWSDFLKYRPALADDVKSLLNGAPISASAMVANIPYAAAMCRIRYYRVRDPLPAAGDIAGYANYWKQFYNGPGKGTPDEFIANWNGIVAPCLGSPDA